jgi:DHA1 family bicyclomycin/chloramphenicol resistance-like MFS transporter
MSPGPVALPDGFERSPTRRQIVLLAALSGFGPLSLDMYLPGLPSVTRELHSSASAGQLTIAACVLGLGLGQLLAGPWSDALGRRRPLLTGLAAYAAASVACGLAPSIAVLMVARLAQGMAGGAGIVIARAIVRDLSRPATAARLFGLLAGITGLAPVIAPLIGGQVLLFTSWRGVFVVLAALGVVLLGCSAGLAGETLLPADRESGELASILRVFGRLLRDRGYFASAASFALSFAALFAYISGSPFVLEDIYGLSPQLFSVVFAANSTAIILCSLLAARLTRRVPAPVLLRYGLGGVCAAGVGALVVCLTGASLGWLLACFVVIAGANGLTLPTATAAAMGGEAGSLGAASALLGLGQFGCGAAVAPLVGLAGRHSALPMGIVMAAAGASALLVNLVLVPRGRPLR